jgi:DNA-3-methyladenine glycosylase II
MELPIQITEHLRQDAVMAKVIAEANTQVYLKPPERNVFSALLESIVSQQLSVKAADTIYARFVHLFPEKMPTPTLILALEEDTLRGVGLSLQKAKYVKNVASFALENSLETTDLEPLSDEELISLLTQIKGVGRWTVEMILMFTLQRHDIFPIDDLGIYQSMIEAYQIDATQDKKEIRKKLSAIAENWRPYRTWACRFLWRWRDRNKS